MRSFNIKSQTILVTICQFNFKQPTVFNKPTHPKLTMKSFTVSNRKIILENKIEVKDVYNPYGFVAVVLDLLWISS